ncbi:MAG TPA: alpha/beta fold hydrolase [Gemmatimonadales bacterium]|nr:alpha/beta fold hydrolase [Gemmatimonadales bacterium]
MHPSPTTPRERHVLVRGAQLFVREIGGGPPVFVLHGGPDFDHGYLLPALDVLADRCRLVYYDQRGRGRSAPGVRAEDVTLDSELADLDALREHLGLDRIAVLGHSFGALLALEYALRHPQRVSHVIVMNAAPVSSAEVVAMRELWLRDWPEDRAAMDAIAATPEFESGDIGTEARYYRLHYGPTVPAHHMDDLLKRMRAHFTPETVRAARAIEDRLMDATWRRPDYDLAPALARLDVPALVLHGERDFVPVASAERIANALPRGRLALVPGTGHFSYLERPADVARRVTEFVRA